MKNLITILLIATATISAASDRRSLSPKKVTQSFPYFSLEVTATITEGGNLSLSFILDGKNIQVPKEALKGIDSPQLETLSLASYSSDGRELERNHLKSSGFLVTLQFGKGRSHGESGVTEVSVYPHVTLYFGPKGFEQRTLTIPTGNYSNSWKTTGSIFDDIPEVRSPTRSIEYPDVRFPNRWQTKKDIEDARKRSKGPLLPEPN